MYKTLMSIPEHEKKARLSRNDQNPLHLWSPPIYNISSSLLKYLHSQSPLLGVGDALERGLGVLDNLLNSADVLVGLLLGSLDSSVVLLVGVVNEDAGGLGSADAEEQEVDGGEEQVARLDDEAPASPDQTGGGQGGVLGEGEVLCGTGEVGGTGEDETPLWKNVC